MKPHLGIAQQAGAAGPGQAVPGRRRQAASGPDGAAAADPGAAAGGHHREAFFPQQIRQQGLPFKKNNLALLRQDLLNGKVIEWLLADAKA